MRTTDLNLATRPFRNNSPIWVGCVVLVICAIGFTIWNVRSFRYYDKKLAEWSQQERDFDQERRDLQQRQSAVQRGVKKYDVKTLNRRVGKANEVIEWRAFSWTQLFNRLVEVVPNNTKMTSVRPVFRDRAGTRAQLAVERTSLPVTIEGLSRDWDSAFQLEAKLIEHPAFDRVEPKNKSLVDSGEVAFSVTFLYYPDWSPDDEAADEEVASGDAEGGGDEGAEAAAPSDADARVAKVDDAAENPELQEVDDNWTGTAEKESATPPKRRSLPPAPSPDKAEDAAGAE